MPTHYNAASLIESYAAAGRTVPYGTYYLGRTVVLGEGGILALAPQAHLIADHEGTAISIGASNVSVFGGTIDGGEYLSDWTDLGTGVWACPVTRTDKIRELFVAGERRYVSQYPAIGDGWLTVDYAPAPVGGVITEVHFDDTWLAANVPSVATDVEGNYWQNWWERGATCATIEAIGGDIVKCTFAANYYAGYSDIAGTGADAYLARHTLRNAPEFLTAGTWCHDRANGRILYMPAEGETIGSFVAVVPQATVLVSILGTVGSPISNFLFQGVCFQHCSGGYPDTSAITWSGPKTRSAITARQYVSDLVVTNCRFQHLGGIAVSYGYVWCSGGSLTNCVFSDCATGALWIGESWRGNEWYESPPGTFPNYGDRVQWDITDNVFDGLGAIHNQTLGVVLSAWADSSFSRNKLRNMPYIAIGCGGGSSTSNACNNNVISDNEFDACMQTLYDGGMLYMPGVQENTVVRDNYFHDLNRSGSLEHMMYYEAGSMHITVRDNLFDGSGDYCGLMSWTTRGEVYFLDNKRIGNLPYDTFLFSYLANYAYDKDGPWYVANRSFGNRFGVILSADATDLGDGTSELTFPSVTWITSGSGVSIITPPLNGWVMFVSGASVMQWHQIVGFTSTTLVVNNTDQTGLLTLSAASGDYLRVILCYTDGNEVLSEEDGAIEVATWLADHPEPADLRPDSEGPEAWFDFPENSQMIPSLL